MAYKVKIHPYGTVNTTEQVRAAAVEFGYPAKFVNEISIYSNYGWLFFMGDTEIEGVKFCAAVRILSNGLYSDVTWAMVMDSDGNPVLNSSGADYGLPNYTTGNTPLAANSVYFLSPVVSPGCGKIDGAYYSPFAVGNSEKGKVFEVNGKKYIVCGVNGSSAQVWLIAADPTE